MTYKVHNGTGPGASYILSPISHESSGYRKLAQMGNTCLMNSFSIHGLQPGTYYWSVQTIDNAFAGSSFPSEQSFTIGLTSTAGNDLSHKHFTLCPNPAGQGTCISWKDPFNGERGIYRLMDTDGKLVLEGNMEPGQDEWLDTGRLPAGLYILEFRYVSAIHREKLVIR
ncbi:MAG: T9SS type A sorting domain-containing protein [Bacteroidales bacterium]|nr:T9SS type A sorting domain-containing protein [Bacteroidales bacterium]